MAPSRALSQVVDSPALVSAAPDRNDVQPVPFAVPAPKGAKPRKSRAKNVISFPAPKGAKAQKDKGAKALPSGGQLQEEWLKPLLPPARDAGWWETPADGSGVKLKFRWRAGGRKLVYIFHRLGKRELTTLKEKSYETQCSALSARIFGELFDEGRRDVALRLTPYTGGHKVARAGD